MDSLTEGRDYRVLLDKLSTCSGTELSALHPLSHLILTNPKGVGTIIWLLWQRLLVAYSLPTVPLFLTKQTPVTLGAAKHPDKTFYLPTSLAGRDGHMAKFWPWEVRSLWAGFLEASFKRGLTQLTSSLVSFHVFSIFLQETWKWWLELEQPSCKHAFRRKKGAMH